MNPNTYTFIDLVSAEWPDKAFATLAAGSVLAGDALHPDDGPVHYCAQRWGRVRNFAGLTRRLLAQIGGAA